MFLNVLFPTAYCLVGSLLANSAMMGVPAWLCCLAHFVIGIAVVASSSGCSCCSVLVVGLVDFLSLFVLGVGKSRARILSISSTTTSTRPLSRLLPTMCPSLLYIVSTSALLKGWVGWGCHLIWRCCCERRCYERPTWCYCCWSPIIMVMSFICKCCWLLGSQLSVVAQYVMIDIVGSCSGCSHCCCGALVALGGKNVLTMLLIADVSTLLLVIKNCWRKQTSTR